MFSWINGKKVYLMSVATILYAIFAAISGHMGWSEAFKIIWESGIIAALRHGVSKVSK